MADIRQRIKDERKQSNSDKEEDEIENLFQGPEDTNVAKQIGQDTGKTMEALDNLLDKLPPRWKNWVIRGIFTSVMIGLFVLIVWTGPIALVLLIFSIQIKCFHEIITIGYIVYRSHHLPWFRTLCWYFLLVWNYFFYGESMVHYFGVLMSRTEFMKPVLAYHRFLSFALYCGGIVAFVISLKKKYYLKQFTLFGWTHVTLLIVVTQSHLIMQNIFEGLVWFLVPVSMIICNDIMAYMFGFFFGRTPLIKLSPKKTWEGFIGGAFSTIIFGLVLSYFLVQYQFFICPISYNEVNEALSQECDPAPVFMITEYALPKTLQSVALMLGRGDVTTVKLYPFMLHSISMSLFASIIGPFGGFFASGFKRAFKIKDFGDLIPGHGGIMDRFDCQFLMATFVHVYHSSFIQAANPQKMVQQVLAMKPEEQLQVFNLLRDSLVKQGLLAIK